MANDVGAPILIRDTRTGQTAQLDLTNHMSGRRLIRSAKNEMDKSTIVSIFPGEIKDEKPTLENGYFHVKPGSFEKPSVLVVGGYSWWKDYDITQPIQEIQVGSIQIAESVIRDYCNGMLGCNMGDTMPGLFFVTGELTPMEVVARYRNKLKEVKIKQDNWFRILVREADSLWARTSGNPLAIWDMMKTAARELNLNDKPWLKDHQQAELIRCVACGNMRNPAYPICPTCKNIDLTHPLAKDLKFAT